MSGNRQAPLTTVPLCLALGPNPLAHVAGALKIILEEPQTRNYDRHSNPKTVGVLQEFLGSRWPEELGKEWQKLSLDFQVDCLQSIRRQVVGDNARESSILTTTLPALAGTACEHYPHYFLATVLRGLE